MLNRHVLLWYSPWYNQCVTRDIFPFSQGLVHQWYLRWQVCEFFSPCHGHEISIKHLLLNLGLTSQFHLTNLVLTVESWLYWLSELGKGHCPLFIHLTMILFGLYSIVFFYYMYIFLEKMFFFSGDQVEMIWGWH